jgi:hypothetical protein
VGLHSLALGIEINRKKMPRIRPYNFVCVGADRFAALNPKGALDRQSGANFLRVP